MTFFKAHNKETNAAIPTNAIVGNSTLPSVPRVTQADTTYANPKAKLASLAAFPIKLNHPHI